MSTVKFLEWLRSHQLESLYLPFITSSVTSLDALQSLNSVDLNRILIAYPEELAHLMQLISSSAADVESPVPSPAQQMLSAQPNLRAQQSQQSQVPPTKKESVVTRSATKLNAYGVPKTMTSATTSTQQRQSSSVQGERIKVCVRKRPLSSKEQANNQYDVTEVPNAQTLILNEPKARLDLSKYVERNVFRFDQVFDANVTNEELYQSTAYPLIEHVLNGENATCFSYGQTGSGKTYTMLDPTNGLYVLCCRDIFKFLATRYKNMQAHVSFYEIYQGQLYDLLNERQKIFAREDRNQNVVIQGITEYPVSSSEELIEIFNHGSMSRSTGVTGANEDSSRSHAVLQITIKYKDNKRKLVGKFSFIDLAGSERGADRGDATDTKTRLEGAEINKSLLALKECIRSLDQESKHTPFRQSRLTQVLKDSFIGNSRTCMIATISPNNSNSEHTLNTLRYAYRVKELKGDGGMSSIGDLSISSSVNASPGRASDIEPLVEEDQFLIDQDDSLMLMDEELPSVPALLSEGDELVAAEPVKTAKHLKSQILSNLNNSPQRNSARKTTRSSAYEDVDTEQLHIEEARAKSRSRPTSAQGGVRSTSIPRPSAQSSPAVVKFNEAEAREFVTAHHRLLRELTEASKFEATLLAQLHGQGFTSPTDENTRGDVNNVEKKEMFDYYVKELDEKLEGKIRSIQALRLQARQFL